MSKQSVKHESPGELVVRVLGGVRPAAHALGFDSHMIVYHWSRKDKPIPSKHLHHVHAKVKRYGVTMTELINGRDTPVDDD